MRHTIGRAVTLGAFSIVSCLALAGCNSEEDAGGDGAKEAVKLLRPLLQVECGWTFTCCSEGEVDYEIGPFSIDQSDCVARSEASLLAGNAPPPSTTSPASSLIYLAYTLDLNRVKVDKGALDACIQQFNARPCNMVVEAERCVPGQQQINLCDPDLIFFGKQKVGEECTAGSEYECGEGLQCAQYFEALGICVEAQPVAGLCFQDEDCQDGLYCDYTTGTCAAGSDVGGPCAYADPENPVPGTETQRCKVELSCDPASNTCVDYCAAGAECATEFDCPEGLECIVGRCGTPGPEGAPCFTGTDCQSEQCDPTTMTCVGLLANGETCNSSAECAGWCDTTTFTCADQAGNGQPCDSFSSDECGSGFCDTANVNGPTCTPFAQMGEDCSAIPCDPEQEISCADDVCRATPFGNGVSCFSDFECESEVCFEGSCQNGTAVGGTCNGLGTIADCELGSYCSSEEPDVDGTCTALKRTGETCLEDRECWGGCVVKWGVQMCDDTPATPLGELYCGG